MAHRLPTRQVIPPGGGIIVIAHRGASREAPENTKAAVLKALARQVDMIEMDVQLTRDQRLVIFHDEGLKRTTDGRGTLAHWRYRDLARLDSGKWFSPRFANERILLASQALRLVRPPCRLNLELKRTSRPAALVKTMARCLRWTRRQRQVLISSFDVTLLRRFQAQAPRIATAVICDRRAGRAIAQAGRLGCLAVHVHKTLVSAALIRRAHDTGLRVHVWTVDRAWEARRLAHLGVDGIFTNAPAQIQPVCHHDDG